MRRVSGYFLIELLLVMALFALLAGGAFFSISFFNRLMVRSELHKLEMVCRSLQWQAITSGQAQTLIFDIPHNSYRYHNTINQLPHQLTFGVLEHVTGPPASPTHTITTPITFIDGTIMFAPSGIISSGTVYLKDMSHTCLYALTNAVSSFSLLRLYRYTNGAWLLV